MAQLNANLLQKIANPQEDYHQNVLNEQAIQANQMKLDTAQRDDKIAQANAQLQKVGSVLYSADTPEKWAQGISYLESQGIEVDEHERDFANRDAILGELTSVADQMKQGVDLQKLAIDRQNAGTNALRARNAGATAQAKPLSPEGKRQADIKAGIITPEQANRPKTLSATEFKEVVKAEDVISNAEMAIEQLEEAEKINETAGGGYFAGMQSFAARNDPTGFFDDEQGQATTNFKNLVLNQALAQLKAIFGAAPTEGERSILIDLQASIDKSPEERKPILKRAISMAEKRLKLNQDRVKKIQGGTYGTPEDAEADGEAESAESDGTTLDDNTRLLLEQAKEALEAGAPEDAVLQKLEELGIDTSELR